MTTFVMTIPDMIGIVGVILTLVAYCLLNLGRIDSDDMRYLLMNLSGSCLLLFSLLFSWNLSSVLIEIAWIAISVIGIVRYFHLKKLAI